MKTLCYLIAGGVALYFLGGIILKIVGCIGASIVIFFYVYVMIIHPWLEAFGLAPKEMCVPSAAELSAAAPVDSPRSSGGSTNTGYTPYMHDPGPAINAQIKADENARRVADALDRQQLAARGWYNGKNFK